MSATFEKIYFEVAVRLTLWDAVLDLMTDGGNRHSFLLCMENLNLELIRLVRCGGRLGLVGSKGNTPRLPPPRNPKKKKNEGAVKWLR